MAPKKESRRPYGRPKEAPGPVQTYEGSFQIPTAPQPGSSHHTLRLSHSGELVPSSTPTRRQRARQEREVPSGDVAAGSSQHGGRRPSAGAHDAASTTLARGQLARTRQADDVRPETGPSKRRRASMAAPAGSSNRRHAHSASDPSPKSDLHQSSSTTVIPSEIGPDGGETLAGPRSWPRTVVHPPTGSHPYARPNTLSPITPTSPLSYRGGYRQAPITSGTDGQGGYSPQGPPSSNWDGTPSTGSLPLTPPRMLYPRAGSYEIPDLSPIQGATWQYPTSAPHTPASGSLRAPSLPPNSASPSPNLGMVGEFDFDLPPGFGPSHTSDLPPLPPDQFPPNMMLTGNTVYPHASATAATATATASRHPQTPFYGQQYPQGSMSAPDLSEALYWPSSIFGEDNTVYAFNGGQEDYARSAQGYMPMPTPHSAPVLSGSGYYAPPAAVHVYAPAAADAYASQPGPPYSPPAGHPYSSQSGPPYASQAQAGPSYSSRTERSPGH